MPTWALDCVVQLINALNYFPTVSLPEYDIKYSFKTDDSTRPRYNFCLYDSTATFSLENDNNLVNQFEKEAVTCDSEEITNHTSD